MDFIFMLTRQDRTIADCLDLVRLIRPLGLKHIGFKDVGVSESTISWRIHTIRRHMNKREARVSESV